MVFLLAGNPCLLLACGPLWTVVFQYSILFPL
uniref:Uncharacterized protein n=1 Tax=Anguilla anguilla TaxID=7936 RepID=A0A0E9VHT9_ANGAN